MVLCSLSVMSVYTPKMIILPICSGYRGSTGYLLASSVPLLDLTVPQSLPCPPITKTWQGNCAFVWVDDMCSTVLQYALKSDRFMFMTQINMWISICVVIKIKTSNNISSIMSLISVLSLKQHFSSFTQLYGACQYLAARCHVSNWKIHTV